MRIIVIFIALLFVSGCALGSLFKGPFDILDGYCNTSTRELYPETCSSVYDDIDDDTEKESPLKSTGDLGR